MKELQVAVIGGGASGTLVAANLLKQLPAGHVWLIERSAHVGRGVAYGTALDCHLLNVRAGNMSADPDDRDGFVRWLSENDLGGTDVADRFVSRKVYGYYLAHVLKQAQASSKARLTILNDEALALTRHNGLRLSLREHGDLTADRVVLAMGNLPPSLPRALAASDCRDRIVVNPWAKDVLRRIPRNARILIVGTGLTMVDVILTLRTQGHQGPIHARSRHGLVSHIHGPTRPLPIEMESGRHLSRRIVDAIRDHGDDWRSAVDALRPKTVDLWQSMTWRERNQFRSRLQVFWDVHRHRVPPEAAAQVEELRAAGQFDVEKGGIVSVSRSEDHLVVDLDGGKQLEVDWIVNCTGPAGDLRGAKLPLLETAVAEGLVEYDPLGLGITVGNCGRAGSNDEVWAIGPLCRGCRLETTAMPEIRVQAKRIAQEICAASPTREQFVVGAGI